MMDSKDTMRQGLFSKGKLWFRKRTTLRIAFFILRLVKLAINIYDDLTN